MFDEKMNPAAKAAQTGPKTERPPVIDGRVEITYDQSGMLANMVMYAPQNGGRPISVQMIADELQKHRIVAGVDEFDIREIVDSRVYDTAVCVARAVSPVRGANGFVTYRYEKNRVIQPKHDEFGIANFRELDTIVPIRKGDIIADITPPTEGTPGVNIFGEPIQPEPGKPARVPLGRNTMMTVDGKYIVASCDGHITYGVGCFNVEDKVVVRSDLDISVGNISFFGDVHIKGNVMEGFSVKAGKSLKIDGTVFSSEIEAGGNVTIVGGLINSTLKAEGAVDMGFCQSSNVRAKGDITAKEFTFSEVFCYGELKTKGNHGVIVGGKITAMRDVIAAVIGSEKYTRTEINIGDGSVTFARKRKAENELQQFNEKYENAVKNIEYLKFRKQQQGGLLSEEQQKLMKLETQNKLFSTVKKKELNLLIQQLDSEITNKDNLSARANIIYPGCHFCINFLTVESAEIHGRSRVTIVDEQLAIIPN